MSKFPGGIFSKASGQVSGLVFSQARTRQGKLMTARQLVIPTNPKTFAQQNNRYAQKIATRMVTQLGPGIYREDWDESEGLNAGFASMLSIIRQNYKASGVIQPDFASAWVSVPPQTTLGDLHTPDSVSITEPSDEIFRVSWSTENGTNGSPSDQAVVLLFEGASSPISTGEVEAVAVLNAVRSDGQAESEISGVQIGLDFMAVACLYFRSGLEEPENLSPAKWVGF